MRSLFVFSRTRAPSDQAIVRDVPMDFRNLLITGGAGFVGSNLALLFRQARPELNVTVMYNLKRRGSELSLPRLANAEIEFRHGDIRAPGDFDLLPPFDLMIDCSAEPSVQACLGSSPRAGLDVNLLGTINCLEAARARGAAFLFLSTSRIYPIAPLNNLSFVEADTRFRWVDIPGVPGFSERGIAEGFTLHGARSFYGASKLACEQLIQEYVHSYGMRALINRCGILAGPWQMAKADQGVITLWVAHHYYGRPLRYTGFDGRGKQVRDILHVNDLFDLLQLQLRSPERWDGQVYNVGGGNEMSVSLRELTALCARVTGKNVPIGSVPETGGLDLRMYVTDFRKAEFDFGWRPTRSPCQVVSDIHNWIEMNPQTLERILD
jgi:CDP-paratose 2-epimerase